MIRSTLILCPSARLARSIQSDIARQQVEMAQTQWLSPHVLTLTQWLDGLMEEALLTGDVANPPQPLNPLSEQLLWEDVIKQSLKKNVFGELFDIAGLAAAAIEANRYMIAWHLHVPREMATEESRQFLQWQRAFQQRCEQLKVLEAVRYMDWQLEQLANSTLSLPADIAFAGFDQTAPQEKRLREVLVQRGVLVEDYQTTQAMPALAQHVSCEHQEAECRAAVAWAQQCLHENPSAKLAIVAPGLTEVRAQLVDLLDDVFYPASVRPTLINTPRHYNFSLGQPLSQQPIIQAALNLLRLLSTYQLQQADVSMLLRSPFWSASQQEADSRALLDAAMREKLPMQFTSQRLLAWVQQQVTDGLAVEHLLADMLAANVLISTKKLAPVQWAQCFDELLGTLKWPGERTITSLEYQAIKAWQKALQQLAQQNLLGRSLLMAEAVSLMQQIATSQVFQAETEYEPSIQILGIMEALSAPVDSLWCMQMNDHAWPPPARPNPLLPASLQRTARVPNADNSVQAAFATTIHHRLMHSAQQLIFSSSQMSGDSQLRVSPLMKEIASTALNISPVATLAERMSQLGADTLAYLDDHIAPAVQEGEHVRGGTGLLKAQAVCPAWAFYQYRLGAKALKTPTTGLDSMERGSLVHDVLECFWRKRHFADLRDMSDADLEQALTLAVDRAVKNFAATGCEVSPTVLALEQERLYKLIGAWLQFEKARGIEFYIEACEAEQKVTICGIEVTLKIDRVHRLKDGGLAFIDYKTGAMPATKSWGEDRITEPQLPIYASFYGQAHVSGVQFAMVKTGEAAFTGLTESDFEAEPEQRKLKLAQQFTDWPNVLEHWKSSIEAIAMEVRNGEAAVQFLDENDLMYCEVKPLLRLPERKLQFERLQKGST